MSARVTIVASLLTAALAGCAPREADVPAASQEAEAQAPVRQAVIPAGVTPSPNYSPGIRSGNLLFAAGQFPAADTPADIESQTRSAMNGIKAIVEAGGSTMANVVQCTVFLVSAADFAGMNTAYVESFPSEPPARSTVVVNAHVRPEAKIEVDCIATLPG